MPSGPVDRMRGTEPPTAMDGSDDTDERRVDGRNLRRERNIAAVVDAVLAMFADESLAPSIEEAARRSGLSLRSVYRYFPDPESLTKAAIEETWRRGHAVSRLSSIGQGPFDDRLSDFAEMRVRLYEQVGSSYRAGRLHAPRSVQIRDDLERTRLELSDQFELQFRPEIDELPPELRTSRTTTADLMSQLDVIDLLRRVRRLTVPESIEVVSDAIRTAFGR